MTDDVPSTVTDAQSTSFRAEARAVGAGRGWDWLVEAFALFRRQPGMWILMVVILGVLFVLMSMIPVLGSLASALLLPIFGAGLMLGCRALDREGTLEISHLFAGFKQNTGNLVMIGVFNLIGWAAMAIAVIAVVGGGVFMGVMRGGSIGAGMSIVSVMIAGLLVAALSVPLYMATWFAPALIVLNDVAPMDALKASFFACLRNWIPFTVYSIVLLVLGLLAAIPLGLGYLVLVPVLAASIYTAYCDIFRTA